MLCKAADVMADRIEQNNKTKWDNVSAGITIAELRESSGTTQTSFLLQME